MAKLMPEEETKITRLSYLFLECESMYILLAIQRENAESKYDLPNS